MCIQLGATAGISFCPSGRDRDNRPVSGQGDPQITIPLMHFHRNTAAILRRVGVGVSIHHGAVRGRSLASALRQVLRPTQIVDDCRTVGTKFYKMNAIGHTGNELACLAGTMMTNSNPPAVCLRGWP